MGKETGRQMFFWHSLGESAKFATWDAPSVGVELWPSLSTLVASLPVSVVAVVVNIADEHWLGNDGGERGWEKMETDTQVFRNELEDVWLNTVDGKCNGWLHCVYVEPTGWLINWWLESEFMYKGSDAGVAIE